jgi:sigma-B regulation protein RsbU (phosphoserine phosphatase)
MEKGDKLFIYTDGIPEATNYYKQMFTIDNMVKSLNNHKGEKPKGICEGIINDVNNFVDGSEQFDDMTMVCFEYDDQQVSNEKELVVSADTANLDKVNSFILNGLDLNPKTEMQITLSVEEIFVNIANYAYGDKSGDATVKVKNENDVLSISFIDSGTPYNPLENNEPDITLDAKDRPIGGLGIFLVKKNMDSVEYEYKDNKNILTMTKKLK